MTETFGVDVPQDVAGTNRLNGIGADEEEKQEARTPHAFLLYNLGPDLKFEFSMVLYVTPPII